MLDGDLDEGLARLLVLAAAGLALLCGWLKAAASFSSHLRRNIRRTLIFPFDVRNLSVFSALFSTPPLPSARHL